MKSAEHLTDQTIETLLNSEPSSESTSVAEDHLSQCPDCQQKLETAAVDPWWWREGHDLFASTVAETQNEEQHNTDDLFHTETMYDPVRAEVTAIVESFLPPIHPELLGQVDEYEVAKLIGIGGMGIVFRGFDRELNRPVAIKFLSPRLARLGISRQRFAREAKATAAICHDNVIPIFRINSSWQYPYFVMPYIAGVSLEQFVLTEGMLEPSQLLQISTQIASGLAAAHEQGLIHRDIKPANILLQNNCNRVVITDFGLAREESDVSLTQTGMIAGTPQYMSPEQAEGKLLDMRSDLFSLGAVMYWMATGQTPFSGNGQFELLDNIRKQTPTPVRTLNPEIPEKLARAIACLLEKNPADRFASAVDVEAFLIQYSAHLKNPDTNLEPTLFKRSKLTKRGLLMTTAFAGIVLASIIAFLFLRPTGGPPVNGNPSVAPDRNPVGENGEVIVKIVPEVPLTASEKAAIGAMAQTQLEEIKLKDVQSSLGISDSVLNGEAKVERITRQKFVYLASLNPRAADQVVDQWTNEAQSRNGSDQLIAVPAKLVSVEIQLSIGNWSYARDLLNEIPLTGKLDSVVIESKIAALASICDVRAKNLLQRPHECEVITTKGADGSNSDWMLEQLLDEIFQFVGQQ